MKSSYSELILLNIMIIGAVYIVDGNRFVRNQQSKTIEYYSLENIKPVHQQKLIAELRDRTGLDIQRIMIEHIDFGRGKALIKIYFY